MIVAAILYKDTLLGRFLEKITGSRAYHAAFLDPHTGVLYEMDEKPRAREKGVKWVQDQLDAEKIKLYYLPNSIDQVEIMSFISADILEGTITYNKKGYAQAIIRALLANKGIAINVAAKLYKKLCTGWVVRVIWDGGGYQFRGIYGKRIRPRLLGPSPHKLNLYFDANWEPYDYDD